MQGWEAGVGPAAFELHKESFFGWAGEVPRTFEGAVSATRALFLLEDKVKITPSNYCQVLHELSCILPFPNALGSTLQLLYRIFYNCNYFFLPILH